MEDVHKKLTNALWRVYRRPERPVPWAQGGNLPWDEPAFSERMLREHLDESHGAASRIGAERLLQIDWLWSQLDLHPGSRLLDVTCGPGLYAIELARRGCQVTGIDFSPASIEYARRMASCERPPADCTFVEQDVRHADFGQQAFDVALFLYGQLAVFPKEEAQALLSKIAGALKPGGRLAVELLAQERVDKNNSTWWFTDNTGLWGDAPFLNLGERFWLEDEAMSVERYSIVHLDSGDLTEITLCDQTYAVETMTAMMNAAGFNSVEVAEGWDGLPLNDADEWVVYIARRA
jgi:SAM-dependent methyltransferase